MALSIKEFVIIIMLVSIGNFGFSQSPFSVSTFHNISLYWSPSEGNENLVVDVKFKEQGTSNWIDGLNMRYNPIPNVGLNPQTGLRYDKADYRGSIVNLTPNTTYDIQLSLSGTSITETFQETTWSENFPISQTINIANMNSQLSYDNLNGTPNGYILIDGTGSTIDVQDNYDNCILLEGCSFVIIRGFNLINASKSIVKIDECHHIVVEDCDMSNWGEEDILGTGFGIGYQSGIRANSNDAHHCVFQRNKIHDPRWDTNSWAELHDPNSDPNDHSNFHPSGPQGIALGQCNIGNNVIRYNEIYSSDGHYFNDILGMWENGSYAGFPGADSDIYGNYLANCFDDAIESEGSNLNVRIWNNYLDEFYIAIGNAATSIGPLYIWRNVSNRAFSHPESVYGDYGGFLKMGYANSINWMTGHMYIFNNTILQPNDHGSGGLGTSYDNNRHVKHCTTLNNIFHVRSTTENSISIRPENEDNSFDYDLTNQPFPLGSEENGINGIPEYEGLAPYFNFSAKTGNFILSSSSDGFDDGVVIPNFCDSYQGIAPDMGAHENGWENIEYGISSQFIPPTNSEIINLQLKIFLQGPLDSMTSLMNDDIRENGNLPLEEPYSSLGFLQIDGGGETIDQSLLDSVGSNAIVDWILVELRDSLNPNLIISTQSALLQRDGDIVSSSGNPILSFDNISNSAFYVVIRHRNHFGVRTLETYSNTNLLILNFSDLAFPIFGNQSMNTIGNIKCLIAGDANGDGQINPVDKNDFWRIENGQPYNYFNTRADFNLDGVVNPVDKNDYWRTNNSKIEQLD